MASFSSQLEPQLSAAALREARVRAPGHVVHRPFPTKTVVLNLQTGRYHGLNPVAGRILELLEREESVPAAARIVAQEYGHPQAEVEADVCSLCLDLVGRGLLEVSAPPRA